MLTLSLLQPEQTVQTPVSNLYRAIVNDVGNGLPNYETNEIVLQGLAYSEVLIIVDGWQFGACNDAPQLGFGSCLVCLGLVSGKCGRWHVIEDNRHPSTANQI